MTEPQRIIDGAGDDIEAVLLRSAGADAPTDQGMKRTLVALGLGAATATVTTAASAAATAKAGASLPPAASVATSTGIPVLVKWLGIAVIGGLAGWGVVEQTRQTNPPGSVESALAPSELDISMPADAPEPVVAAPAAAAPDEAAEAVEPAPAAEPQRSAARVVAPVRPTGAETAGTAPRDSASALTDEIAALDKARKQMAGDPQAALSAIDAYKSNFRDGVLAQEAEVLRIESMVAAGKSAAAKAAAAAFLARHPSSPAAQRVRSLVAKL